MAALLLSVAGQALGNTFGPAGAMVGRIAGAIAGSYLDRALFGPDTIHRSQEGPRLADLDVMASSEGAPIPRIYGRVRLSGQVIWATKLEEVVSTRSETTGGGGGGKGGGGGGGSPAVTTTTTTYSYFGNFAVGLCEGPIGHVLRIWADGKPLDLSGVTCRIHKGDETQAPDPLIVAKEGANNTPAYRGLAYVVFERLPLANFGNRIPQLSFEVLRPVGRLEQQVRAVTLIPGATEFGYEPATVVQVTGPGQSAPENRHVAHAPSDVIASLDELQAVCPHLERVAIVVAWFGDDLRAGRCKLRPGIDNVQKSTHGANWNVAGLTRGSATLVSQIDGRPAFGGTPSDASVIHLIHELKARGLKVTLYPFVMMDIPEGNARPDPWSGAPSQPAYPWRGDITCDPAPGMPGSPDGTAAAGEQIAAFFAGGGPSDWNYRRMILHYAALAASAGGVDAFVIGSELKSLTRVRSASGVYPAVTELVSLAADVKAILGSGCVVIYAADWTEYGAHVVDAGANEVRFPLDPLWASPAIGAIGIDYYPPLADWRDTHDHLDRALAASIHDRDYLKRNLAGGEAYDFFYADAAARSAQTRTPITDGLGKPWIFRQKDLWSFWSNQHYERVGGTELASPTDWIPQSKPFWLTETGCPAVDKGGNQPSIFPDLKSANGGFPHFSNGRRDDVMQRRYLETVLSAFAEDSDLNPASSLYTGRMVDPSGIHLWTWDARPYPVFPAATDVWSDGPNWATGHWLTGRLGASQLEGLVSNILSDAEADAGDASALGEGPDGYVIDRPMAARAAIEPLALTYAFDAVEGESALTFRPRGGPPVIELNENDLVLPREGAPVRLQRAQETDLPREVTLGYIDAGADYRRAAASSRRLVGAASRVVQHNVAMVTNDAAAARRADIWLQDVWAGRESAEFALPPSLLRLMPGDVIALTVSGRRRLFEIREIVDTDSRAVTARAIDPEVFDLPLPVPRHRSPDLPPAVGPVQAHLLDLPTLDASEPPVLTRIAVFADPWPGPVAIWSSGDGLSYTRAALALAPSIIGVTLDDLPAGPAGRFDHASAVRVQLHGGALVSVSDAALLNGANVAALQRPDGAWEVVQFARAELVGERTYILSRLLRGQAGSESAIGYPLPASAPFVLLDQHVIPLARGLETLGRSMHLRIVAAGRDHGDVAAVAMTLTPQATALRPLSPVHLAARRTDDGVLLRWIRRTRIDGDSWETQDVPLGEAGEAYEIDILDGGNVVRKLTASSPSVLYVNVDEFADFGSPQASITFRVAQMSASVGRGFPSEMSASI
ncbi:MAG: glycoside hydrolase/phage tail family protein [Pseudorhodoplanes sp.]|jgi:hypothetical protein|nr:glycoside hydrolase/phage tail family protein [Pseudorhodoplanes sp.]